MLELTDAGWPAVREAPVSGVDLAVAAGGAAALLNLGPEQRLALIDVLTGRRKLASGLAHLSGRPLAEAARRRGVVIVVGPEGAKATGRAVRADIEAGSRGASVATIIDALQLAAVSGRKVRELDGKARLRLALACAVARKPALIVLDRALAASAPDEARSVAEGLKRALDGRPTAVLVLEDAVAAVVLGGPLVVLEEGRVVQRGDAVEVASRPETLAVALATSSPRLNTLRVRMDGGAGRLADGTLFTPPPGLNLPAQGGCTLAFRPDDVKRERDEATALRFAAREEGDDPCGYARIGFGGETWLAPMPAELWPGRVVNAFVSRERMLVFDDSGRIVQASAAAQQNI